MSAFELIEQGDVSSPIAQLDLELSDAFSYFLLDLIGFKISPESDAILVWRMSSDGGETFHSGSTDYLISDAMMSGGSFSQSDFLDDSGALAYPNDNTRPVLARCIIDPGAVGRCACVQTDSTVQNIAGDYHARLLNSSSYKTTGRQNAIRLLSFTPGNISAGSYALSGVPL